MASLDQLLVRNVSLGSRNSAVGIATGYGLDSRGVGARVPVGERFFPLHVVQTRSGAHPVSESGQGMKLTTHLQLVPRSRIRDLYIYSPMGLHGVVFN
jgi:hypothetical protein